MRLVLGFSLLLAIANPAFGGVDCQSLAKKADQDSAFFHPPEAHVVKGSGRLYFFSAPNSLCKMPAVFVIPGDQLVVYAEHGNWYQVIFLNQKTLNDYEGWVEKARLKYQGTVGPGQ
jgi:hypothetical protein